MDWNLLISFNKVRVMSHSKHLKEITHSVLIEQQLH